MGISSELARMPVANGDGTTKAFDYDFRILSAADLKVIVIASDGAAVTQTYPTHYAVTGVGDDAGGTVVFTTAPAATDTVLIVLDPAITQLVDFTSDTYENAFDRLTLMMKRAIDIASRALRVSDHDTTNLNDLEVTLGNDKILGTNSSGQVTALTIADIDGLVSVTAPLTYSGGVLGLSSTAPLNNSEATSPPTASHDSSLGYSYHSRWGGPTLDEVWVCIDASVGAAVWVLFTGALASLDTVDTAEIEDDAIDSQHYKDGSIDFAHLADTVDEDNMSSDSATKIPTQQSVKAYVDSSTSGDKITASFILDGTGTPSYVDQTNMASVTDLGTGKYQCTFATAMSNTNYRVIATKGTSGGYFISTATDITAKTTTSFYLVCRVYSGAYSDINDMNVIIVGGV